MQISLLQCESWNKKHLQRMFSLHLWKTVSILWNYIATDAYAFLCFYRQISLLHFLDIEINTDFFQSLRDWICSFMGISLLFFKLISAQPICLELVTYLWGRRELSSFFKEDVWVSEIDSPKVTQCDRNRYRSRFRPLGVQTYIETVIYPSWEKQLDLYLQNILFYCGLTDTEKHF